MSEHKFYASIYFHEYLVCGKYEEKLVAGLAKNQILVSWQAVE